MKIIKKSQLWLFLFSMVFIVSCKSTKEVTTTTVPSGGLVSEDVVKKVNSNRITEECVVAKMNLSLEADVHKISVGGNLKMKRNDVIQLSLMAFGFVEAGRVELTRDYILVIDRIGRQYVKATYKEMAFLRDNNIDFYAFQSLFWNELFIPGQGIKVEGTDFSVSKAGENNVLLENKNKKELKIRFVASLVNGLIKQTNITSSTKFDAPQLNWSYVSYGSVGKKDFPEKMQISIDGTAKAYRATLVLSNMKNDAKWETRTDIAKGRYKKVPLETIYNRIMSL